jgi:hypothetical protein
MWEHGAARVGGHDRLNDVLHELFHGLDSTALPPPWTAIIGIAGAAAAFPPPPLRVRRRRSAAHGFSTSR